MSLIDSIDNILKEIGSWFHKELPKAEAAIVEALPAVTEVIIEIKNLLGNPVVDSILGAITKNPKVVQVANQVSNELPVVLTELGYLQNITVSSTEEEKQTALTELINSIPGMTATARSRFYSNTAAGLLTKLYSGDMTWAQAIVYVEGYFQVYLNPTAKAAA